MKRLKRPRGNAFTLVEVLITIAIVSIAGTAIISSLIFGVYMRQSIRERNGAMRAAADVMESTKKRLFGELRQMDFDTILIDNRGTVDTSDDIMGTASLRFFDRSGNEVGTSSVPMPMDLSLVRAEVIVEWNPPGRRSSTTQSVVLATLLAP